MEVFYASLGPQSLSTVFCILESKCELKSKTRRAPEIKFSTWTIQCAICNYQKNVIKQNCVVRYTEYGELEILLEYHKRTTEKQKEDGTLKSIRYLDIKISRGSAFWE